MPAGSSAKNVPSAAVVVRATSVPAALPNTSTAPPTGRGAHAGSGGLFSTGQTGPAVTTPPIPVFSPPPLRLWVDVGEAPVEAPAQPVATTRTRARASAPRIVIPAVTGSTRGRFRLP